MTTAGFRLECCCTAYGFVCCVMCMVLGFVLGAWFAPSALLKEAARAQACPPQGFPFWGLPPSVLAQLGAQRPPPPLGGQGPGLGFFQPPSAMPRGGPGGAAAADAPGDGGRAGRAGAASAACGGQDCTGTSEPGRPPAAPAARLSGSDGDRRALPLGGCCVPCACRGC